MKIKIFLEIIEQPHDRAESLESRVNEFLQKQPGARVQWLQSSAGGGAGGHGIAIRTTITAIITYD